MANPIPQSLTDLIAFCLFTRVKFDYSFIKLKCSQISSMACLSCLWSRGFGELGKFCAKSSYKACVANFLRNIFVMKMLSSREMSAPFLVRFLRIFHIALWKKWREKFVAPMGGPREAKQHLSDWQHNTDFGSHLALSFSHPLRSAPLRDFFKGAPLFTATVLFTVGVA